MGHISITFWPLYVSQATSLLFLWRQRPRLHVLVPNTKIKLNRRTTTLQRNAVSLALRLRSKAWEPYPPLTQMNVATCFKGQQIRAILVHSRAKAPSGRTFYCWPLFLLTQSGEPTRVPLLITAASVRQEETGALPSQKVLCCYDHNSPLRP